MKNTFELEHVGINTDNAGEAEQLALLLCKLFNLEPRHGQKSEFAGNYFECMKSPFLGKNGHIAMQMCIRDRGYTDPRSPALRPARPAPRSGHT